MRGAVICTICATLQAGWRHKRLSDGHRLGCAMMMLAGLGCPARMRSMLFLSPKCVEVDSLLKIPLGTTFGPRSGTKCAGFGAFGAGFAAAIGSMPIFSTAGRFCELRLYGVRRICLRSCISAY